MQIDQHPRRDDQIVNSQSVAGAVLQLFDDLGFDQTDFVIQHEPHSALARDLGLLGGLLRVQCRSTNEDRLYSTGRGSTWMASVLGDIADGHFTRALRRDASGFKPPSRPAAMRERQQHGHDEFADTTPDVRLPSVPAVDTSVWGQVALFRPRTLAMQAGLGGF